MPGENCCCNNTIPFYENYIFETIPIISSNLDLGCDPYPPNFPIGLEVYSSSQFRGLAPLYNGCIVFATAILNGTLDADNLINLNIETVNEYGELLEIYTGRIILFNLGRLTQNLWISLNNTVFIVEIQIIFEVDSQIISSVNLTKLDINPVPK
ncbi:MAG: hypothetical protein Harvfovirus13_3 [Harvfovirus sp.]|uniref:Uncharacterized protein n=1 Tax=Harvfovirus sp. TaxID=2487768 RepID=A0A3G5A1A6_9VIRU|nr:MAG: hypothetical protein Harvfovirus13_3 [Harvfovirus sp.]